MFKKYINLNKLSTLLFYISIIAFIIAFNFAHNPPGGWYQQFMPELNGATINGITFTDSLTGYSITTIFSDTSYILKTINSGENWSIINRERGLIMKSIQFFNKDTGVVGGTGIIKTINGGINWITVNSFVYLEDLYFISNDTGWYTYSGGLTGGVFRTTNGGASWTQQFNGNPNPDRIYMFNKDIGFISAGSNLLKTTNSGLSWTGIPGAGNFLDMYFIDSLVGWKSKYDIPDITMQKTINGGINWVNQALPIGGYISESSISNFENINEDTIWGVGGNVFYGAGQGRGIVYRTTNGGENWLYQIPDTSIHIGVYTTVDFDNKLIGWLYSPLLTGIHTRKGGDSIFTNIKEINNQIPNNFILKQNYPNPFNPVTIINYELRVTSYVFIKVCNLEGKEIKTLVNRRENAGSYKVEFDGSGLPSGVYFYSLFIDGERIDTKKMMLVR